jgi:hypothetical protein
LTGRKGKDDGRQRENARRKTTYEALDLAALGLVSDGGDGVDVLLGELDKSQVGLDAGRSDRLGDAVKERGKNGQLKQAEKREGTRTHMVWPPTIPPEESEVKIGESKHEEARRGARRTGTNS